MSYQGFLEEFERNGGWINREAFSLEPFEGMGYGAKALKAIQSDEQLFHIPLSYLLTPYTSTLSQHLGPVWESLGGGWAKLILVMMWESQQPNSKWREYLASLPKNFDTPIFWSEEELKELVGTDIEHRVGREQVDRDYHELVAPILAANPDLFNGDYSLEHYHVQGSRILSRSFTIPLHLAGGPDPEVSSDATNDEEEEIAVMVPLADMLNAAYERDNARLMSEDETDSRFSEGYTMTTVKSIEVGEQIYNTYGHPPNSELIRKYGHVDVFPLENAELLTEEEIGDWPFGNPGDEVEIRGDAVVAAIGGDLQERVEWWLEDGQEDTFGLTLTEIDPALVAFIRLLISDVDWERAKRKGKTPSIEVNPEVGGVVAKICQQRLQAYPQSIQDDLQQVKEIGRRRLAAVVRLGEKRILRAVERAAKAVQDTKKRKNDEQHDRRKR